jgi:hypothetical protein
MLASAPGLLSTTTGLFHRLASPSAKTRAAVSFVEPAGKGTITRTGLLGQSGSAQAGAAVAPATSEASNEMTASSRRAWLVSMNMMISLLAERRQGCALPAAGSWTTRELVDLGAGLELGRADTLFFVGVVIALYLVRKSTELFVRTSG